MRITQRLVLGLLAASLPVQFAVADADAERTALARISHELEAIEPLITEAAIASQSGCPHSIPV